jgi:hypothetical protein
MTFFTKRTFLLKTFGNLAEKGHVSLKKVDVEQEVSQFKSKLSKVNTLYAPLIWVNNVMKGF